MCVEVVGYSERGMVNALCLDLLRSEDCRKIETFLKWFDFSHLTVRPCFSNVLSAQLIVEQSFSDFGDLDLLILLKQEPPRGDGSSPKRQAVLIEAKVSTDTDSWQAVGDRLGEFVRMLDGGEGSTSNLFVQLHRKMRLVEALGNGEEPFQPDLLTPQGRLGANRVVRRACRALADHLGDGGQAWYGAIVPDDPEDLNHFSRDLIQHRGVAEVLSGWDATKLGFLSWKRVYKEAEDDRNGWSHTASSFDWNEGQIFRDAPPDGQDIQPGGIYLQQKRYVFVVPARMGQTCRVALLAGGETDYFWRTEAVPVTSLDPCQGEIPSFVQPHLPVAGHRYTWVDQNDGCPGSRRPHPSGMAGEVAVEVVNPSWLTTRVRRAGDEIETGSFLVCTHHLRRGPVF